MARSSKLHSACIIVFVIFFRQLSKRKGFSFLAKCFRLVLKTASYVSNRAIEGGILCFEEALKLIFFRTLKKQSVFCEKYSRRECQFCVLPNHWDNSRKVFFLMEKLFLSPCFWYLEKRFWQSGIPNGEVFITAFCVFIRTFWWMQFQWKTHIVFIFLGHWAICFDFLALSFQQVCRNCFLNVHWNTSSSFFYIYSLFNNFQDWYKTLSTSFHTFMGHVVKTVVYVFMGTT